MKLSLTACVLAWSAAGVLAQEPPALPDGVITDAHPLKQSYIHNGKNTPALFRASPNMPEIVNEQVLRGQVDADQEPVKASGLLGYMPKLTVLPCATGCEGSEYDKAVQALVKGFRGDRKAYQERGEMIVQVRWFKARTFLERQLPYGADLFGVSFMLEGKVVSMGKKSAIGGKVKAHELAADLGGRLAFELAYSLGMGVKPRFLLADGGRDKGVSAKFMNAATTFNGALGVDDVRPRIEPASDAHAQLLPAIDGIGPNEIEPIAQMYYLNSWVY
ncbi:MAG: hypothetical protein ACLGI6_06955 [Gammaproteobacteria bacterium]